MVIGAAGLIGNAVAHQLYNDGQHVIMMSRNKKKARSLFPGDIEILGRPQMTLELYFQLEREDGMK